jgi:hypothetical protein
MRVSQWRMTFVIGPADQSGFRATQAAGNISTTSLARLPGGRAKRWIGLTVVLGRFRDT